MNQDFSEKNEQDKVNGEHLRGEHPQGDEQDLGAEHEGAGAELAKAKQEAADYYDKYLRALAELENIKRRSEREKSDLRKYGLETFIREMLPVLDSFDQALPAEGGDKAEVTASEWASFLAGMQLVKRQLLEALERQGLSPVKAVGERFDPNLHQAIQRQERADVDCELVGAEYSKGYTLQGRLLRPAMVSVVVPGGEGSES